MGRWAKDILDKGDRRQRQGRVDHLPNGQWMTLALIGYERDEGRQGAWALALTVKECGLWQWGALEGLRPKEWLDVDRTVNGRLRADIGDCELGSPSH